MRDSFTIPKSEYEAIVKLKLRANRLAVPAIKTGRPGAEPPAKKLAAGKAATRGRAGAQRK